MRFNIDLYEFLAGDFLLFKRLRNLECFIINNWRKTYLLFTQKTLHLIKLFIKGLLIMLLLIFVLGLLYIPYFILKFRSFFMMFWFWIPKSVRRQLPSRNWSGTLYQYYSKYYKVFLMIKKYFVYFIRYIRRRRRLFIKHITPSINYYRYIHGISMVIYLKVGVFLQICVEAGFFYLYIIYSYISNLFVFEFSIDDLMFYKLHLYRFNYYTTILDLSNYLNHVCSYHFGYFSSVLNNKFDIISKFINKCFTWQAVNIISTKLYHKLIILFNNLIDFINLYVLDYVLNFYILLIIFFIFIISCIPSLINFLREVHCKYLYTTYRIFVCYICLLICFCIFLILCYIFFNYFISFLFIIFMHCIFVVLLSFLFFIKIYYN
jgi:hypothetical protein